MKSQSAAQKLKAKINKAKEEKSNKQQEQQEKPAIVAPPKKSTPPVVEKAKQQAKKSKQESPEQDVKVAKTLVENNTNDSPIREVMFEVCTGSYDSRFVGFCYRYFTSNDPKFETVLELPQAQLIKFSEQQKLKEQPLITTTFATKPHAGSINQLLSTKKYVITTGYDELALVYDLVTRRELRSIPLQQGNILDVGSLKDQYTAFATANGVISLHAGAKYSFTPIWEKVAHKGPVASIAIHPSGRLLLSVGQNDNKLRVWDMIKGSLAYTVNLGKHSAERVRFSSAGNHFFIHYREKVVIHDTESLEVIYTLAHESNVTYSIYVGNDYVATGTQDGKITIWDLENGECLQVLDLHETRIKSLDVKEVNVGEYCLCAVSSDGGLSLWRLYLLDEEVPPALLFYEVFNVRLTSCCLWTHFASEHQQFMKERKLALQKKLGVEGDMQEDEMIEDSDSDDDYEYVMEGGEEEGDEMQDDE
ncbi:predicted protein [Naegleria gruberi]|uniref:Predicted protein n=1 Tax=Naegleria gruberi TaxID=5762 RepID=D2V5D3_NAEGR|nr:uncharacterized protein NAEGRDRAFT_63781 [Naegleria gruberi]EFC47932.1 predicted protein [Naegleria gruberi]|eukprot:XP_002680676.1 predicted protein [Naegleria gruberi strain NEG-M]